jgi:hypothetical protein
MKVNLGRGVGRTLGVAAMTVGLVMGAAEAASAYSDPAVNSCVNFVHTNNWWSKTQKVVGTNKCTWSSTSYRFQIYNWVPGFRSYAASTCFSVGPGEGKGWQWPRPGRPYYITSC